MRKLIVVLAVLALVSPAFAFQKVIIATGGTQSPPHVNATTVAGPLIVSGAYVGTGFTGGNKYNVGTLTLATNQAPVGLATGWSDWAHEVQASYEWAVYGGPPANVPLPIQVQNLATGAVVSIPTNSTDAVKMTQVNDNGDVFWMQWGTINAAVMHANVANPGVITQIGLSAPAAGGARLTAATSSDRVAYRLDTPYGSGADKIAVYDLSMAAQFTVFDSDGNQKLYHPAISDDGNWMAVNVRTVADGTQKSDLYLVNLNNLAAPVVTQLTNDLAWVRNDPDIDIIDPDHGRICDRPGGRHARDASQVACHGDRRPEPARSER